MPYSREAMGEYACLITLGWGIDADVNRRVHALAQVLHEADLAILADLVPAYNSLLVRFYPASPAEIDQACQQIDALAESLPPTVASGSGRLHEIPVCYGAETGQDLAWLAQHCGLTQEEVVRRHTAVDYQVAMIGFAPGFSYLLGMDASLAAPRRSTPRTGVPAGSVAIAGAQTGIYPAKLPGGWQLIGRTPTTLFDAGNNQRPCLLMPGDRVRFIAIDEAGWQQWEKCPLP